MSRATRIKYIVAHVTAGFSSAERTQAYFLRSKAQGGRGWNTGGYHVIIEEDGTVKRMYDYETITNGVRGFNSQCIHISMVGGLKRENGKVIKDSRGKYISDDTRTPWQKHSFEAELIRAIMWLKDNGKDIKKDLAILGHRDFSVDNNRNGVIDPQERIKDCPCFDTIPEYNHIYGATNSIFILPQNL